VKLAHPVTTDHVSLTQVTGSVQNRWITRATLIFDGKSRGQVSLGPSSRQGLGETVHFATRTFRTLRIRIDATTWKRRNLSGASGVGFSTVAIPGVHIFEWTDLPTDLLSMPGAASLHHRLTVVLTRNRVSPIPPRSDPELALARRFTLPAGRRFSLSGTARISALIPDNVIDDLVGGPNALGGAVIGSDARLPGDLNARAAFAFDGNPSTFWSPGFDYKAQVSAWVEASLPHTISFNHMDLKVIADGRHSVPTELKITSNTGRSILVPVPPVKNRRAINSVASVPLSFASMTGSTFRISIVKIRNVSTVNWYSESALTLPVGIADFGIPGIHVTPENASAAIPSVCRNTMLRIDGKPISLEVTGTVGTAEALGGLSVKGCGPDANGISLGAGQHTILATWGKVSGIDLDRLVLDSGAGGAAQLPLPSGTVPAVPGTLAGAGGGAGAGLAAPSATVLSTSATSSKVRFSGVRAGHPFWLVLGESINKGWHATLPNGADLGTPVLIDGYANGWYVDPTTSGSLVVTLAFTPQRLVTVAIGLSALTLFICFVLAVLPERPRRAISSRVRRLLGRGRRRQHGRHGRNGKLDRLDLATAAGAGGVPTPAASAVSAVDTRDAPVLELLPGRPGAGGRRPQIVSALLVGLVMGLLCELILPPVAAAPAALGIGVLAALAALLGWPRRLLGLLGFGLFAAAGAVTAYGQQTQRYLASAGWTHHFETAGALAFVGIMALVADAMVELVRTHRKAHPVDDDETPDGELPQEG
jgi:hypothetical protein